MKLELNKLKLEEIGQKTIMSGINTNFTDIYITIEMTSLGIDVYLNALQSRINITDEIDNIINKFF